MAEDEAREALEFARKEEGRFQMFLIGLTFAILGAALQTTVRVGIWWVDLAEGVEWPSFIVGVALLMVSRGYVKLFGAACGAGN